VYAVTPSRAARTLISWFFFPCPSPQVVTIPPRELGKVAFQVMAPAAGDFEAIVFLNTPYGLTEEAFKIMLRVDSAA
jgi:hypothetical protein